VGTRANAKPLAPIQPLKRTKRMKKGNFYQVNNRTHELIEIEDDKFVFQNIYDERILKVFRQDFQETAAEIRHIKNLGLLNELRDDIAVVPISTVLGSDLSNLTLAFFGFLVFKKDEIAEIQPLYNEVSNEIHAEYDNKAEISIDFYKYIQKKLKTVFSIND